MRTDCYEMKNILFISAFLCFFLINISAVERRDSLLSEWRFHLGEVEGGEQENLDDSQWEPVKVPHDWAITMPFSGDNDLQNVAVKQNGESVATLKTGRTGGLPWMGTGWYRTRFLTPQGTGKSKGSVTLLVDGAMSIPLSSSTDNASAYGLTDTTVILLTSPPTSKTTARPTSWPYV